MLHITYRCHFTAQSSQLHALLEQHVVAVGLGEWCIHVWSGFSAISHPSGRWCHVGLVCHHGLFSPHLCTVCHHGFCLNWSGAVVNFAQGIRNSLPRFGWSQRSLCNSCPLMHFMQRLAWRSSVLHQLQSNLICSSECNIQLPCTCVCD